MHQQSFNQNIPNPPAGVTYRYSLPRCFADPAASSLLLILRCWMKILFLWFPSGTPKEVSNAFLPGRCGAWAHRVSSSVFILGWTNKHVTLWNYTSNRCASIMSSYWLVFVCARSLTRRARLRAAAAARRVRGPGRAEWLPGSRSGNSLNKNTWKAI